MEKAETEEKDKNCAKRDRRRSKICNSNPTRVVSFRGFGIFGTSFFILLMKA